MEPDLPRSWYNISDADKASEKEARRLRLQALMEKLQEQEWEQMSAEVRMGVIESSLVEK